MVEARGANSTTQHDEGKAAGDCGLKASTEARCLTLGVQAKTWEQLGNNNCQTASRTTVQDIGKG